MDTNCLVLTGSSDKIPLRDIVSKFPEDCLYSGSVSFPEENSFAYLCFSFVNKECLSYAIKDIDLKTGVKVEITRHDEASKFIQQEEDKLSCERRGEGFNHSKFGSLYTL